MNFLSSYNVNSNGGRWKDTAMLFAFLVIILLYPFFYVINEVRRQYWLSAHGYWVSRKGRDNVRYEERHRGIVEHLVIYGEMMAVGAHVVYVPSEERWRKDMPEWAKDRRDNILERVKGFLGNENYGYELW